MMSLLPPSHNHTLSVTGSHDMPPVGWREVGLTSLFLREEEGGRRRVKELSDKFNWFNWETELLPVEYTVQ